MPAKPCDFCGFHPFNEDDIQEGGNCDRPNGSTGWACRGCFPRKYRPNPEWSVPEWAMNLAKKQPPEECLSRLRRRLFRILEPPPYAESQCLQREAKYLRSELEYRTAAVKALSKVLDVPSPEFIEPAIYPLRDLLSARAKRSRVDNHLHEHRVRHVYVYRRTTAHNFPWEALSIARALLEVHGISWETHDDRTASALAGAWRLSVWPERDGWMWRAELSDRSDYPCAGFTGLRRTMEDAKSWAEYKARHTLLG